MLSSLRCKAFFSHEEKRVEYLGTSLIDRVEAANVAKQLNQDSVTQTLASQARRCPCFFPSSRTTEVSLKGMDTGYMGTKLWLEPEERLTFNEVLGAEVTNVDMETFVSWQVIAAKKLKPCIEELQSGSRTSLINRTTSLPVTPIG